MPDITMCPGNSCPRKQECYRFTATPNEHYQSYFVDCPVDKNEDGSCTMFWSTKDED